MDDPRGSTLKVSKQSSLQSRAATVLQMRSFQDDKISDDKAMINIETKNNHILMEDSQDDLPSKLYLSYIDQNHTMQQ